MIARVIWLEIVGIRDGSQMSQVGLQMGCFWVEE